MIGNGAEMFPARRDLGASNRKTVKTIFWKLTIHMIDVGQGDAFLIDVRGYADDDFERTRPLITRTMLVDGGRREYAEKVLSHLEGAGVKKLDNILFTHGHDDHYGASARILKYYARSFWLYTLHRGILSGRELYDAFHKYLMENTRRSPVSGDEGIKYFIPKLISLAEQERMSGRSPSAFNKAVDLSQTRLFYGRSGSGLFKRIFFDMSSGMLDIPLDPVDTRRVLRRIQCPYRAERYKNSHGCRCDYYSTTPFCRRMTEVTQLPPGTDLLWYGGLPDLNDDELQGAPKVYLTYYSSSAEKNENNNSVGVVIHHGNFRMCMAGDLEYPFEEEMAKQIMGGALHGILGSPARMSVLKCSHHSAPTSTSPATLNMLKPLVVLISCGDETNESDKAYEHPDPTVIRNLQESPYVQRVYLTSCPHETPFVCDAGQDQLYSGYKALVAGINTDASSVREKLFPQDGSVVLHADQDMVENNIFTVEFGNECYTYHNDREDDLVPPGVVREEFPCQTGD